MFIFHINKYINKTLRAGSGERNHQIIKVKIAIAQRRNPVFNHLYKNKSESISVEMHIPI